VVPFFSTENKLKQLSTLGPNLFAGKFFDLLHDSAENIRDAKETQHLRKIKVVDKQESKPSNLHVGHNLLIFLLLGMKPQLSWSLFLKGVRN
jgi:hypothetical protein